MTFRLGTTLRTAQTQAFVDAIGASGTMKIFTGAAPANCAASDPAGTLATITIPNPSHTVSGAVATKAGTWSVAASGTGTAASFRVYDGSAVCVAQGTITATGGGGDATIDNTSVTSGQTVTVNSFTYTSGAP